MLTFTPYEVINGLLTVDVALINADDNYAAFSVRVPRALLARNADILDTLSDLAGGFDITPASPPEQGDGSELLKVPFAFIGANEKHAVFSVRVSRRDIAESHRLLMTVAKLAAPLSEQGS
jgi:hypothetical protein